MSGVTQAIASTFARARGVLATATRALKCSKSDSAHVAAKNISRGPHRHSSRTKEVASKQKGQHGVNRACGKLVSRRGFARAPAHARASRATRNRSSHAHTDARTRARQACADVGPMRGTPRRGVRAANAYARRLGHETTAVTAPRPSARARAKPTQRGATRCGDDQSARAWLKGGQVTLQQRLQRNAGAAPRARRRRGRAGGERPARACGGGVSTFACARALARSRARAAAHVGETAERTTLPA